MLLLFAIAVATAARILKDESPFSLGNLVTTDWRSHSADRRIHDPNLVHSNTLSGDLFFLQYLSNLVGLRKQLNSSRLSFLQTHRLVRSQWLDVPD